MTPLKPVALPCELVLALLTLIAAGAQAQPDVDDLLLRVGERVGEFYKRATNVVCTETSTVLDIDSSHSPQGFARTVESELRVEVDPETREASLVRRVLKVNGRPPRHKDEKDRAGCTDPNPLSAEPLSFLLPEQRPRYQFRPVGMTKDRDRTALMIDFTSVNRRSTPELIEDPGGHDDCFDWSGHIASRGRIWVDAARHDVLRVERGLRGPTDVKVPVLIQRRYRLDIPIVIVRDDVTIRYKAVDFSDPDEVLLLPDSIDSLTIVRGGLQSTRRTQTFSGYKRFVTGGRVLP